jgi:hypothetical protein
LGPGTSREQAFVSIADGESVLIGADLTRKLGAAGVDLGAMGIQWGKRPDELPAWSVTARDLRLLRFLHDFGYATTSTLAALFWGRYGSAVRER